MKSLKGVHDEEVSAAKNAFEEGMANVLKSHTCILQKALQQGA
jgi:hypothetical protein